jgi:hypothetical protein
MSLFAPTEVTATEKAEVGRVFAVVKQLAKKWLIWRAVRIQSGRYFARSEQGAAAR